MLSGNSSLMMYAEETGVLRLVLSGTYGEAVQLKMLQSLRHVLLMEEVRWEDWKGGKGGSWNY